MLAKILVGVLAAVAVTGVGVYFALPESGHCCGTKDADQTLPVSEGASCCAAHTAVCPTDAAEPTTCCAAKPAPDADGLSACVGGMATAAPTAAAKKACTKCCDE